MVGIPVVVPALSCSPDGDTTAVNLLEEKRYR